MKISEAITFIINQNDKKLLTDSKRFKSYLLDLCSDHQTELKIVKRALGDKVLERIFGNERDNVKIARLRDEFEAQGMAEDWREFIISSFAEAIGWNYTSKTTTQERPKIQQVQPQQTSSQLGWSCSCGCVNNGNFCSNCGKKKGQQQSQQIQNQQSNNNNSKKSVTYNKQGKNTTQIITKNNKNVNKPIEVTLDDYALEILGYKDKNAIIEIDIPEIFKHKGKDYIVTSIKAELFKDCKELVKVTIPQSVISIENNAFENCKNLKEVIIPDIVYIGNEAFKNCRTIKSLKISENMKVGENAFKGVKNVINYKSAEKKDNTPFAGCVILFFATIIIFYCAYLDATKQYSFYCSFPIIWTGCMIILAILFSFFNKNK